MVEAVPERMDLKREVLGRVAAVVGPEAVVATNTSGLSITALGRSCRRRHGSWGCTSSIPPA